MKRIFPEVSSDLSSNALKKDNETRRKFPDIKYDMSQNIVRIDKEMTSLTFHSLVLCIAKILRESANKGVECVKFLANLKATKFNYSIPVKVLDDIEKYLEDYLSNSHKHVSCKLNLNYMMQRAIHYMVMQISDFVEKSVFSNHLTPSDYLLNLEFTSQGTINLSKSIFRVLEKFSGSPLQNHYIMCYHFLDKKIIKDEYERREDIKYFFDNNQNVKNDYSIYFWKCELDSRPLFSKKTSRNPYYAKWLDSSIPKLKAYENIFIKAIKSRNEIAVEYLWNNHISGMESREAILEKILSNKSVEINIFMFLLLQVNEMELVNYFETESFMLIERIIEKNRWHCIFNNVLNVLKIHIKSERYPEIFYLLTDSYFKDSPTSVNLDIVLNYFSSMGEHFKIIVIKEAIGAQTQNIYGKIISEALIINKKDLFIILGIRDKALLNEFFKSESGLNSLTEAFKNGNIEFIYWVLKDFLDGGLTDFLKYFFNKKSYDIGSFLIKNVLFEEFIVFAAMFTVISPDEIKEFKAKILIHFGNLIVRKIIFPANKIWISLNIKRAERLSKWLSGSNEMLSKFKKSINLGNGKSRNKIFYENIQTCVLNSKFYYLSELLEWKEFADGKKLELLQNLLNDNFINTKLSEFDNIVDFLYDFKIFLDKHGVPTNDFMNFKENLENLRND